MRIVDLNLSSRADPTGDKNVVAHYLPRVYRLWPVAYLSLPVAFWLSPVANCPSLIDSRLLPMAYRRLPIGYRPSPITCRLSPIAYPDTADLLFLSVFCFVCTKPGYLMYRRHI